MKRRVFITFLIGACFLLSARAQQTPKSTYHNLDYPVRFLEYLPPDYSSHNGNFPLLVYLHGGGEAGDGTPESLERVKSWGPPRLIANGSDMCFTVEGEKTCFIVISPQLQLSDNNWVYTVSKVMDHILNGPDKYKVDVDRIYLTGISRGGMGVYQYAASAGNYPNKLAAIAPIAAWSEGDYDPCQISRRRIPVWAFHGRLDTVVPYRQGTLAFTRIESCANPAPEAEMIFTTYEDRYHDSWIPAYNEGNQLHSPNLYEWLLQQKRAEVVVTGVLNRAFKSGLAFSVHPNPATDLVSLSFQERALRPSVLTILTLTGRVVSEQRNQFQNIDVSALSPGVYVILLTNGSGIAGISRFVKAK